MKTAKTKSRDIRRQRRELLAILKREPITVNDFKRLICARSAFTPKGVKPVTATQIAYIVMMQPQTVRNIRSTFRKKGPKGIIGRDSRGGRRRANLSLAREQTLLRRSCAFDKLYDRPIIEVSTLKTNYRKAAKAEPLNYRIYRLLQRHGCERIAVGMYSPPKPVPVS